MPEPLLDSLWRGILDAADPVRIRFAIKGLFLLMLVLCIFVFIGAKLASDLGRDVVSAVGLVFTFIANGVFVLGLAHLTARGRSRNAEATPLAAAFSNFSAAAGTPTLFAAAVALLLLVESVFFSLGRVGSLGEVLVSLAFMPVVLLNAGLLLASGIGVWLGAAVAARRGIGAVKSFKAAVALIRRNPRIVFPVYVAAFFLTGLLLYVVWMAMAFPVSLTLWTAQQAMPGYRLVLITGLPQFTMGAFGPFGAALTALASGAGVSSQLANLIFLCMALLVAAAAAAYPTVLLSEISMRICDAGGGSREEHSAATA